MTPKKQYTADELRRAKHVRDKSRTAKRRERMIRLRAKGLSQDAIAKLVGCSQRYVSTALREPAPPDRPSRRERILYQGMVGNLVILVSSRCIYARVDLSE